MPLIDTSLPVRERGLKQVFGFAITHQAVSLPVRERGLKQLKMQFDGHAFVAPRAGAWIETSIAVAFANFAWSLPVRERGLKQATIINKPYTMCRSPCGSVD